jgi:predicted Fe-Mo cluster-binding NifX family protein
MKIAIASEKDNIESIVSNRGGRSKYYLIFENKTKIETLKNPFAIGGGGAGFSVIEMLNLEKI